MFTCPQTYYLGSNGKATTDSANGANPVLLVTGAVLSDEEAARYELQKAGSAPAPNTPVTGPEAAPRRQRAAVYKGKRPKAEVPQEKPKADKPKAAVPQEDK